MVKSKLHRVTVTDGNLTYPGSITICPLLMKAANIRAYEYVHINNVNSANHWETYAIPGEQGDIILNGPPARLFQPGDPVVILTFQHITDDELETFTHTDVNVDQQNRITKIDTKKLPLLP